MDGCGRSWVVWIEWGVFEFVGQPDEPEAESAEEAGDHGREKT